MTTNAAQNSSGGISQWVTFTLNGEINGIDVMQVQEVLRMTPIAPVPGAPHFVLGVINLRGNVVTVIEPRRDSRRLISLSQAAMADPCSV